MAVAVIAVAILVVHPAMSYDRFNGAVVCLDVNEK